MLLLTLKPFFVGKISEESLAEEEQLNDLLLLIKLLSSLLSKDSLDFGSGKKLASSVAVLKVKTISRKARFWCDSKAGSFTVDGN